MQDKKTFEGEFGKIFDLLRSNQSFSFSRFSDGERTVLANKRLVIEENYFIQADVFGNRKMHAPRPYLEEERKDFDPSIHNFYHKKLMEAYKFKKENYLKGICGRNETEYGPCFEQMIELHGGDSPLLTFSNVLQNNNYSRFVSKMIPEFCNHEVILVANKNSKYENLPFEVKKFYPIGRNCMINDYHLVEEISSYIETNNITNHLFLFAATLSNFLCFELYKKYDSNKYMDIGSTLGPLLGLEGWKNSRGYLTSYWLNSGSPYANQVDIW